MLQVFFGTDQIKVRQAAHMAIDSALSLGEECVRIEGDGYQAGSLLSVSSSVSLFSPRIVYLLDSPASNEDFYTELFLHLEALASSEHTFVVVAEEFGAADKKQIAKQAAVVEEYKSVSGASFNIFKMAEALAVKDKRSLWLLLEEAKQNNLSAEEIVGTLWWQLKSIRVASVTKSPEEAGMKDYPYKKAKSALRTFPLVEIEKASRKLLALYHDGHRGKRDIDLALEEWVLTL